MSEAPLLSRREYLTLIAVIASPAGAPVSVAVEAVASVAIEHPELDMDERRTFEEWRRT